MPQDCLTVLVVSKSSRIRNSFKKVVSELSNLILVGETDSWEDTLRSAETLHPSVIWIDIRMPGCHQFAEDLKTAADKSRIMTIDLHRTPQHVIEITGTGANVRYRFPGAMPALHLPFHPVEGPPLISLN